MTNLIQLGLLVFQLTGLAMADLKQPQSVLSFHGVYGTNFNETITFCNPPPTKFELHTWKAVTVLARAVDSGQSVYNEKGILTHVFLPKSLVNIQ